MSLNYLKFLMLLIVSVLQSCASGDARLLSGDTVPPLTERKEIVSQNPDWTEETKSRFLEGEMTTANARLFNSLRQDLLVLEGGVERRRAEQEKKDKARREVALSSNPGWPSHIVELIRDGKIGLNMTVEQVEASWGPPTKINRSASRYGIQQQWIYRRGDSSSQYVFFEDGLVSSWSES